MEGVKVPARQSNSTHVFHQYTLLIEDVDRESLKKYLELAGIPCMVYYPLPLHKQEAFKSERYKDGDFPVAETLCNCVLSLPMHTELEEDQLSHITGKLTAYVNSVKQLA